MSPTAPRSLFALEFGVIVVPYGALVAAAIFAAIVPSFGTGLSNLAEAAAVAVAILVPYVCGFRLALAYLLGGNARLIECTRYWWWGAYAGAAIPIVGAVALLLKIAVGDFAIEATSPDPSAQPFGPTTIGDVARALAAAPLLIPLGHLYLAGRGRMRSNTSLERTRAR